MIHMLLFRFREARSAQAMRDVGAKRICQRRRLEICQGKARSRHQTVMCFSGICPGQSKRPERGFEDQWNITKDKKF
ncbi:hypothetical protein L596_011210 [Steinernema carpocapsae]|uniref:Uncharacterized protein n=1 Tax=Steinernema carpocapsae TaxID=34508 RepID=A0A4V6XWD7_STECR|nr:hypothetical protein L596_011210 [Steinernema carpocapsae]